MSHHELIPHLFRTEFRKITAVLCKAFGLEHMAVAEDLASETFLAALETWSYQGVPPNPTAWLYTVAKNKTRNYILRTQVFADKITPLLQEAEATQEAFSIDLSPGNITDSQLQMLFAICHPSLPVESQVALALRMLCGLGIDEIATAFLASKDTINKRLFRAREKLRTAGIVLAFPGPAEIPARLDAVMTTLYLLFSEGYYSESQDTMLREDLCLEAMQLTHLLVAYEPTNLPPVKALLSLMCFHASRFEARRGRHGEPILYDEQDETLWNQNLIVQGAYFLYGAATGGCLTKYHLEATIAYWNTQKADTPEKWEAILQLYNQLLSIAYSPVAALNRTYALSKARGKAVAIPAAEQLKLEGNPFYFALLGELYTDVNSARALQYFEQALSVARTAGDQQTIRKKIDRLRDG